MFDPKNQVETPDGDNTPSAEPVTAPEATPAEATPAEGTSEEAAE